MAAQLLEREDALRDLGDALARARDGHGQVALVTGDAGAGKTSVVREFVRTAAGRPRILTGACDPLSTPRPLGPLLDAAVTAAPDVAASLAAGANRSEAFAAAWELIAGDGTTVFVVEDVHWADDATLDLLTFLGRRISSAPALVVLTYRDDEVDASHPLRSRLGELAPGIRCRVRIPPLTEPAVARLAADTALDPARLHAMTGGNAFYVTEVIGAEAGAAVPDSVSEAVVTRASRLPRDARAVLDAVAVHPGRVPLWLLDSLAGDSSRPGLDVCVDRGLLLERDDGIMFRHELARLAIADALASRTRHELHARALATLATPPVGRPDQALLAHHAAGAGDADAVIDHAPAAAAEASTVGAHREAASHLASAVRYGQLFAPPERADLLVKLGDELSTLARAEEALAAYDEAVTIWAELGDVERQAETLVSTAGTLVMVGRQPESIQHLDRAGKLVEARPPGLAAVKVAVRRAGHHMLARRFDDAERMAQDATGLAMRLGFDDQLAEILVQGGIARAVSAAEHLEEGIDRVQRGIALGRELGDDHLVALGHSQIGSGCGEIRRYDLAVPALREGIEFCEAREMMASGHYMQAWLARCELELGRWEDAATLAGALVRNPRCVGISRFVALVTLGWLRGRRGDPDVAPLLDEALDLARATRHLQRLWPIAACRTEIAWLHDRLEDETELLAEALDLAVRLDYRPAIEELAMWRRIADGTQLDAADPITPFGLVAGGRVAEAAERWDEIGCPYEAAVARHFDGDAAGDASVLRVAYDEFARLGARPMADRTALAIRAAGGRVPRGPNRDARDRPFQLTEREVEVLTLVTAGRTNAEIGRQLGISPKTVGHHVSRVLTKMNVRSRTEAATTAERLGITLGTVAE